VTNQSKNAQKKQGVLVNRERDLAILFDLLPPRNSIASVILLKSPSGFGKTRLTTKIIEVLQEKGVFTVAVEPQVRAKNMASSVYQGFYIQRCAEAIDKELDETQRNLFGFETFLKNECFTRVKRVDVKNTIRKPPGIRTAYSFVVELLDRVLNMGEHSPKKLLTSDSREAIDTCERYIRYLAESRKIVLVIREAQHIDQASLGLLREIVHPSSIHALLLEYTLDTTGHFNQLYSDLIEMAELSADNWLHIVELFRLSQPHLAQLLRTVAPAAEEITGEYYLQWDGNVRSISQMKFLITVEQFPLKGKPLQLKDGVIQEYQRQVGQLTSSARFILCLLLAHGEAIPKPLLILLLQKINVLATRSITEELLETLMSAGLIVHHTDELLVLENEDLAEALSTYAQLLGNLLSAKAAIRDYYWEVVTTAGTHLTNVSLAVRQTLRLAVELGDASRIAGVVSSLTQSVTTSVDQSWYVTQIANAVGDKSNLFAEQQDYLLMWAAELAYEISDFRKAQELLRQIQSKTIFSEILLCACYTETGEHSAALQMTHQLAEGSNVNERFAGKLIELILLRCTGKIDEARALWNYLAKQPEVDQLELYGYLLRFKELVEDFPNCLEALRNSTDWFLARGLIGSAAYSELTIAGHIARQGDNEGAVVSIAAAQAFLTSKPRDQHILLNNEVAVNLLSDTPIPGDCCEKLIRAISCSGDDYSDIVLYTNLAVCALLAERHDVAAESTNRALRIATNPYFADRDVFWGVSFNLQFVNAHLKLGHEVELELLFSQLRPHSLQNDYWQYRRGFIGSSPSRYEHMLSKPYHPMFLSHWIIDVDGLRVLKPAPSLAHQNTTNQSL